MIMDGWGSPSTNFKSTLRTLRILQKGQTLRNLRKFRKFRNHSNRGAVAMWVMGEVLNRMIRLMGSPSSMQSIIIAKSLTFPAGQWAGRACTCDVLLVFFCFEPPTR